MRLRNWDNVLLGQACTWSHRGLSQTGKLEPEGDWWCWHTMLILTQNDRSNLLSEKFDWQDVALIDACMNQSMMGWSLCRQRGKWFSKETVLSFFKKKSFGTRLNVMSAGIRGVLHDTYNDSKLFTWILHDWVKSLRDCMYRLSAFDHLRCLLVSKQIYDGIMIMNVPFCVKDNHQSGISFNW